MEKLRKAIAACTKCIQRIEDGDEWVFVCRDGTIIISQEDGALGIKVIIGAPVHMNMEIGEDELAEPNTPAPKEA